MMMSTLADVYGTLWVFVPHTPKTVTLSRRDTMCITMRSLGTESAKAQETACGSAWTWSTPWVWIAHYVLGQLWWGQFRRADRPKQLHLLVSACFTFIKLLPSTPEREQKSLLLRYQNLCKEKWCLITLVHGRTLGIRSGLRSVC